MTSQTRAAGTATSGTDPTRRTVIAGAGAVAGATVLAACGSASTGTSGSAGGGGGSATASVPVKDVPVGGGTILQSPPVVVTQPTQGTFEAFSAICPHAGCPVTSIADGLIRCPCHGSQFDITTGDVKAGPAPHGLAKLTATVAGNNVDVS